MTPRTIERVLARSLAQMDLGKRVARALPGERALGKRGARVVAIGKAAPAMACGALARWGNRIDHVVAVTTDGTDVTELEAAARRRRVTLELLRASHPVSDARSVRAAERCLAVAHGAHDRVLLVLVSGGASALVCSPSPAVSLATKRAVTRTMLASGASIQDLNVVRKHLSRIKGGALARAAAPGPVVTLAASDVIGGSISDIGSGPSTADPSSVTDARRLLRRYAPDLAGLPLVRTGAVSNELRPPRIVASAEELGRVVATELRGHGLRVRVLPASQAPVDELAREYLELAASLGPGCAIVRAAEPSVALPASRLRGRGGRCCHLAAGVGLGLGLRRMNDVTFVAMATDGVDGPSGAGGAVVDGSFAEAVGQGAIARALARFDTGPLHLAAGTALPLRPTGHNLADVHVLVRSRLDALADER